MSCVAAFPVSTYNTHMATPSESVYDTLISHINGLSLKTYEIQLKSWDTLYYAYKRELTDSKRLDGILRYIRYLQPDVSMKCRTCIDFIRKYSAYVFVDGKTLFGSLPNSNDIFYHLKEIDSLYTSSMKIVIVDGPIGTLKCGGFNHIYIDLPKCVSARFTTDDYQWFINQHYNTLSRLMSENNNEGIIPSLKLLLSLLPKGPHGGVPYGYKIEKPTEWFYRYMSKYLSVHTPHDRNIVVLEALLGQYMVKGYAEERIVATYLKQMKDTVLPVMSRASSKSALTRELTNLFNPEKYMRKTKAPSEGDLDFAMNILDGFFTIFMTVDNLLKKYGGKAPPRTSGVPSRGDAMSIWGAKKASLEATRKKGHRGGAGGFAQRAGVEVRHPKPPTTFKELFDRINEFPNLKIYVTSSGYNSTCPVMLTEYPDTANQYMKHPFLWAFRNGTTAHAEYNIPTGYHRITAMTKPGTMGQNVFFAVSGARFAKANPGNTCFPAFLKESVQRKAGRAFELLNKTNAKMPTTSEPLALGIGTSCTDSHGNVAKTITFKTDTGVFFTISKWD